MDPNTEVRATDEKRDQFKARAFNKLRIAGKLPEEAVNALQAIDERKKRGEHVRGAITEVCNKLMKKNEQTGKYDCDVSDPIFQVTRSRESNLWQDRFYECFLMVPVSTLLLFHLDSQKHPAMLFDYVFV